MTLPAYRSDEPTRAEIDAMPGWLLLEFGAPWCGFCQALAGHLADLLERRPGLHYLRIEDGRGRPLGRSFGVKLWPNLILRKDGDTKIQLARPSLKQLASALALIDG